MTCPKCRGTGSPTGIAGHCFDIDGGLWHEPGKCTAPECKRDGTTTCCHKCEECGGSGRVD